MKITWKGQSCFEIVTKKRGEIPTSIVIDTFSEDIGLKLGKLKADILLVTHNHHDHNNIKAVSGNPFLIMGPGEYEIKGVFIQGIPAFHDNVKGQERGKLTIYTIETAGLSLCHLGDLGQRELTSDQIEQIGEVDVLMIPIGGTFTISAKEALKIMSQIEPKVIIPMHYALPKLKIKLDGLDKFLKILGMNSIEPESKLSIRKRDLSEEEAKIIILKP
jgi:L-ascorbate metabolism protein UlaG (beta-lactamase superfamily)